MPHLKSLCTKVFKIMLIPVESFKKINSFNRVPVTCVILSCHFEDTVLHDVARTYIMTYY